MALLLSNLIDNFEFGAGCFDSSQSREIEVADFHVTFAFPAQDRILSLACVTTTRKAKDVLFFELSCIWFHEQPVFGIVICNQECNLDPQKKKHKPTEHNGCNLAAERSINKTFLDENVFLIH